MFRNGQEVIVKSLAEIEKTLDHREHHKESFIYFNKNSMVQYTGKRYIIANAFASTVNLKSRDGAEHYTWHNDWIKPINPLEEAEEL